MPHSHNEEICMFHVFLQLGSCVHKRLVTNDDIDVSSVTIMYNCITKNVLTLNIEYVT